jgi:excisionase family DNA binding protein
MSNPFDMIDVRLNTIESLLISLKHGLPISSPIENEQPVTVKEICSFLGVTEPTIIRWRKKGKVPFLQVGSRILFQKSAVLKALENKKGATKI